MGLELVTETPREWAWTKENPTPEAAIAYVDEAILEVLPPGTQPIRIWPSGVSYYAQVACIEALDANGDPVQFFVKITHRPGLGRDMVRNEYEAMAIMYRAFPALIAEPLGWGELRAMPGTYFFASRYVQMLGTREANTVPGAAAFTRQVAEMHRTCAAPDGRFGFPLVMHSASGNALPTPPADTWEACFAWMLRDTLAREERLQGPPGPEMARLRDAVVEVVVPRLLRPLETGGRRVVPSLCHGDLWDNNSGIDARTGRFHIFDPLTIYAHNEYELAPWKLKRHTMSKMNYIDEYVKHFPPCEPVEEFDDRVLLYALKFNLLSSSCYAGELYFRNECIDMMKTLVGKYAPEAAVEPAPAPKKTPLVTTEVIEVSNDAA